MCDYFTDYLNVICLWKHPFCVFVESRTHFDCSYVLSAASGDKKQLISDILSYCLVSEIALCVTVTLRRLKPLVTILDLHRGTDPEHHVTHLQTHKHTLVLPQTDNSGLPVVSSLSCASALR